MTKCYDKGKFSHYCCDKCGLCSDVTKTFLTTPEGWETRVSRTVSKVSGDEVKHYCEKCATGKTAIVHKGEMIVHNPIEPSGFQAKPTYFKWDPLMYWTLTWMLSALMHMQFAIWVDVKPFQLYCAIVAMVSVIGFGYCVHKGADDD